MLIKLTCECWVSADEVTEVKMNPYATSITVRTKDGVSHSVNGGYAEMGRLIEEINKAKEKP